MEKYRLHRKLDAAGRLVLPLEIRRALRLDQGERLRLSADSAGDLRLSGAAEPLNEATDMVMDELGRVRLPAWIQQALHVRENTVLELSGPDAGNLILRPVVPCCCACGSPENLLSLGKAHLCAACRREVIDQGENGMPPVSCR